MPNKTVSMRFVTDGAQVALDQINEIADAEEKLREPVEISVGALGEEATEQIDALKGTLDSVGEAAGTAADGVTGLAGKIADADEITASFTESLSGLGDAARIVAELEADLTGVTGGNAAAYRAAASAAKALAESNAILADSQKMLINGTIEEDAALLDNEAAQKKNAEAAAANAEAAAASSAKYKMAALGLIVVAAASIKMAGDFDQSTTRFVTSAGESAKNLSMVQSGILQVSSETATSSTDLANAMYIVESAGYHGAAGLAVLKAAAEGAKAEGADVATVANAVSSAMNAYGPKIGNATQVTNQLLATVSAGKMTMQDFSASLSAVLPIASASGVSFAQVGGAIATMTAQGMSAQQAAQDLAHTIGALSGPNNVAIGEMEQLGINVNSVEKNLGKNGLTGTLDTIVTAITSKMGPAGTVLLNSFDQSKDASNDLNVMLKDMPPNVQKLARSYMDGSMSLSSFRKAIPTNFSGMISEFTSLYNKVHGFNSVLAAGSPAAQTFQAALRKIMGGQTGLNTALLITGGHLGTFEANTKSVGEAAKSTGSNVTDWNAITDELNFKMKDAEVSAENVAIAFGQTLMPAVLAVITPISAFMEWIAKSSAASKAFALIVGGTVAVILGTKLVEGFLKAKTAGQSLIAGLEQIAAKLGLTTTATEGATVAQGELDVAMDANPIGAVILLLVGLVAVILLVVTHLKLFREIWSDVFEFAKRLVTDALDFIKDHWALIVLFLIAPMPVVIAELAKHWRQILDGVEDMFKLVIHWFKSLGPSILNVLKDAGTWLYNVGKQVIMGLVHGLYDAGPLAWDAIKSVGSGLLHEAESIFGIASPSKEFAKLGRYIVDGLSQGIMDRRQSAIDESKRLAADILTAFQKGEITSSEYNSLTDRLISDLGSRQRKLATELAGFHMTLGNGLLADLSGTPSQVNGAVDKLISMIKSAMNDKLISVPQATGLSDLMDKDNTRLKSLASQRQTILNTIKTADKYAAGISSAVMGDYSLTSAATNTDGTTSSAAGIIANLKIDVNQVKSFAHNIATLRKMGLNKTFIDQLLQAGPVSAGPIAAELASGPLSDVQTINSEESQLSKAASALGVIGADAMYDSGKDAGQGFLSGLQGQQSALEAIMKKLAASMVTTIKKELGINSPSTVFAGHGDEIVNGLVLGITRGIPRAVSAMRGLSMAIQPGTVSPLGGNAAGLGRQAAPVSINVTVTGVVGDAGATGRQIGQALNEYLRQTGQKQIFT